ncbi:hypothetical protein DV737_g1142, partial [Chaetothyriales sp. CBS 132003]
MAVEPPQSAKTKMAMGEQDADLETTLTTNKGEMHLQVSHQYESNLQMKKQFGTVATLGIAFAILNSWVAEAGSLLAPIALGGPVTIIWGCVAGVAFTTVLCAGVAEMASALPGAGGPYHYTFVLAAPKHRKFLVKIYWSLACFFVCLITTVAMHHDKPYQGAAFVFGDFSNESGWSNGGIAFVIGWMLSTYNVKFPPALTSNGWSDTGSFWESMPLRISRGILVAGRTTWAFARDNGMPFSRYLSVLDGRAESPVRATLLSTFLAIAYGAIYIGSAVAFQSIVGSSIIMLFTTYGM